MNRTPEEKIQRGRDKANLRDRRVRLVKFQDELSQLVFIEAHDLRKKRNLLTGISWHVDHSVPLKGKLVSGLHIWSNIRVIPKTLNLRKGNKFCPI